jgi:hypothetical protein
MHWHFSPTRSLLRVAAVVAGLTCLGVGTAGPATADPVVRSSATALVSSTSDAPNESATAPDRAAARPNPSTAEDRRATAADAGSLASPPEWFPLRGTSRIGCTYLGTGDVCGGTYHETWALDLGFGRGQGAEVFAAGGGQAHIGGSEAGCGAGDGTWVWVDHGDGVVSRYFHLASIAIADGQEVDANTVLGTVGDSGQVEPCGAYHLHFDVRTGGVGGTPVDPGPLKACHGDSLVTYPQALGHDTWEGLPGHQYDATSDGTACAGFGEGSFIRTPGGDIYRIAGGAPIYVSSWEAVGGEQPYVDVTDEQFAQLPVSPADGTWLLGFASDTVYVVAGTSPIKVHDCETLEHPECATASVVVDQQAIDRAGEDDPYHHLAAIPANGTFLSALPSGRVWQMQRGALRRSTDGGEGAVAVEDLSLADYPSWRPTLRVDSVRVEEGDRGVQRASFTVRLSSLPRRDVEVRLTTTNGTARAPQDYEARKAKITIPRDSRTATVVVRVRGDQRDERLERFYLDAVSADGARVGDGRGRGVIRDDDRRAALDTMCSPAG